MKKIFVLFAALVCGMGLNAKTLYLQPNSNWTTAGARFAIYAFDDSRSMNQWYDMTAVSGGYYSATVDDTYPMVIFCRMNPGTSDNNWNNKWNQTQDMAVEAGKDLCVIADGAWDNAGSWSVYNPGGGDNPGGGGDINPGSGNYDYYIRGYFDGEDTTTPELDHLFEDGILSLKFSGDGGKGYFYVMVCEYAQIVGRDYMLKDYTDGGTHVTLYDKETTGYAQKWGVPEGTVTFYLYDNGDGTRRWRALDFGNSIRVYVESEGTRYIKVN